MVNGKMISSKHFNISKIAAAEIMTQIGLMIKI